MLHKIFSGFQNEFEAACLFCLEPSLPRRARIYSHILLYAFMYSLDLSCQIM